MKPFNFLLPVIVVSFVFFECSPDNTPQDKISTLSEESIQLFEVENKLKYQFDTLNQIIPSLNKNIIKFNGRKLDNPLDDDFLNLSNSLTELVNRELIVRKIWKKRNDQIHIVQLALNEITSLRGEELYEVAYRYQEISNNLVRYHESHGGEKKNDYFSKIQNHSSLVHNAVECIYECSRNRDEILTLDTFNLLPAKSLQVNRFSI